MSVEAKKEEEIQKEKGLEAPAVEKNKTSQKPEDIVNQTGRTAEEKAADMVTQVAKDNPTWTPQEVSDFVVRIFKQNDADTIKGKVENEAARLAVPAALDELRDFVYLKKDKDKKFPVHKSALDSYIVRQTQTRKLEDDNIVEVPATGLNEFAVYTKEEYERLSEPEIGGFARMKVNVEVWHEPGAKGDVQD